MRPFIGTYLRPHGARWLALWLAAGLAAALTLGGCAAIDAKQRELIFQPSDRIWQRASMEGMEDVWIDYRPTADTGASSAAAPAPVRLHGLWLEGPTAHSPVLLYLHGARWNVTGSTARMRRMQALGFGVLAIDYQGFGQSTKALPSEASARADALAAWQWLAARHPTRARFVFGHSLGGAIAIDLATQVRDAQGVMVEGTFTHIRDVIRTFKWGWLPVGPLITQPFDAISKVPHVGAPLLVVHGSADQLIPPALGERLHAAAAPPKAWVVVEGGSHHSTHTLGQAQYRQALQALWPQWFAAHYAQPAAAPHSALTAPTAR